MVAGFAFSQLMTPLPQKHSPGLETQFSYLGLTCVAIGFELVVIICCTYLAVWGPGLALRGQSGSHDLHAAVSVMRDFQGAFFALFILGWVAYFVSSMFQLWIYFEHSIASVVICAYAFFLVLIVYYTIYLTNSLRLSEHQAVEGKMDVLETYEMVGDIDGGLHGVGTGATQRAAPTDTGYCPILEKPQGRAY
jgi:hypothetical protein